MAEPGTSYSSATTSLEIVSSYALDRSKMVSFEAYAAGGTEGLKATRRDLVLPSDLWRMAPTEKGQVQRATATALHAGLVLPTTPSDADGLSSSVRRELA